MAFVLLAATATAQPQFYHRVGDTIRGQCPIYYYDWYWDSDSSLSRADSAVIFNNPTFGYQRHTTSSPLKIIGIASSMRIYDNINFSYIFEGDDTTSRLEDTTNFFILFQATPNGPRELKRVCWTDDIATHPKRYIEYVTGFAQYYRCDNLSPAHLIAPIREYYFDSAVYVTDSFYLGISRYCVADDFQALRNYTHYTYQYLSVGALTPYSANPCFKRIPTQHFIQRTETSVIEGEQSQWRHQGIDAYQLIYPIIEVDTVALAAEYTCLRPSMPEAVELDTGVVRFSWTATGTIRWQLALTPEGGEERIYDCPSMQYTVHGLNPDTSYLATVRGYCRNKMWEGWGDWSDTLTYTPPQPQPVGIPQSGNYTFSISPNPASTALTVIPSAPLPATLTVLDIQGRIVLTQSFSQTHTRSFTLDISTLPAGAYILEMKLQGSNATCRQQFVKQ